MRYDNYIETMHHLSSWRATATALPKFREYRVVNSSGNTSRSDRHLKVGLMAGQQPLGISQTLKVSGAEKTEFANWRLNLPIDAFKLPIVGLNGRLLLLDCQLSHLNCQLSGQTANGKVRLPGDDSNHPVGTKNSPGTAQPGRWEQKTARGRLKSLGEQEKQPGDGSIGSVSTSFGPGTAQTTRERLNPARGAVNMGGVEKLTDAGEFALPPVSASLRKTELAAAWCICNNHAILPKFRERGSDGSSDFMGEKRSCYETSTLFQNVEMEYEHFSSWLGGVLPVKSGGRWLTEEESMSGEGISAPLHRCKRGPLLLKKEEKFKPVVASVLSSRRAPKLRGEERSVAVELQPTCHLEGGRTERSVATELCSNRFLTSFGMTDELATCNLHLATELLTIKYNNPQSKYWDDRVVNSNFIPDPSPCRELPLQGKPVLNRAGAHPTCSFVGSKLFPLKKGKPCLPAGRWLQPKGSGAALIEKKAHLSKTKFMGTGDNELFPFFLISNLATALPKFRDYCVCNRINKPHESPEISGVRQQQDSHWNANVLPLLRGGARRAEGYIVANTNKTSAYET
ncbi:hypothetical protein [Draconibacterium orientale]|uniref:hypothetical protein n=1 Tax=Draconibacterium orientale TaxID=1168034 RepID=UPI002A0A3795|nr:hypothetical protein [Draconibacterium orientale]